MSEMAIFRQLGL